MESMAATRCNGSTFSWCNSVASAVAPAKVSPSAEELCMSAESATGLACGGRTRSSVDRISEAVSAEKNERSGGRSGPELVTAPANLAASSPWSSRTTASRRWAGSRAAAPLLPASIRARKTTRRDLSENWSNNSPLHLDQVFQFTPPQKESVTLHALLLRVGVTVVKIAIEQVDHPVNTR